MFNVCPIHSDFPQLGLAASTFISPNVYRLTISRFSVKRPEIEEYYKSEYLSIYFASSKYRFIVGIAELSLRDFFCSVWSTLHSFLEHSKSPVSLWLRCIPFFFHFRLQLLWRLFRIVVVLCKNTASDTVGINGTLKISSPAPRRNFFACDRARMQFIYKSTSNQQQQREIKTFDTIVISSSCCVRIRDRWWHTYIPIEHIRRCMWARVVFPFCECPMFRIPARAPQSYLSYISC